VIDSIIASFAAQGFAPPELIGGAASNGASRIA